MVLGEGRQTKVVVSEYVPLCGSELVQYQIQKRGFPRPVGSHHTWIEGTRCTGQCHGP